MADVDSEKDDLKNSSDDSENETKQSKKKNLTLEITYLTGWKKVSLNNRELTITQ